MKNLIIYTILILAFFSAATAQTAQIETVSISKEAAITCLENSDKAAALTDELKVKNKSIEDLKDELEPNKNRTRSHGGRINRKPAIGSVQPGDY